MSYRSDHDAALARVDALESELATLRRHEPSPPPAAPRRSHTGRNITLGLAAAGLLIAIGAAVASHKAEERPPAGRATAIAGDVRAELRDCVAGKELRLAPECRMLIDGLATDVYADPDLRAAVGAWGTADHELETAAIDDGPALDRALAHRASALQQVSPLL